MSPSPDGRGACPREPYRVGAPELGGNLRGRVLRHIGEDLEKAVELLVDHHLEEIHGFKRDRDQRGRFDSAPNPKGFVARKRRKEK